MIDAIIDKDMMKKALHEKAGLTKNVIAQMKKDENVSTEKLELRSHTIRYDYIF